MRIRVGILIMAVLALVAGQAVAQQAIHWQPTVESAQRLAAQTNRLVLVHFWADWCHACKRLEREVLSQPPVAAAIEASFVPVKVNADHFPATCKQMGVTAFPTDVILAPDGRVIERIKGAAAASTYVGRLNQVVARMQQPPAGMAAGVGRPSAPVAGAPNGPPPAAPVVATAPAAAPNGAARAVPPATTPRAAYAAGPVPPAAPQVAAAVPPGPAYGTSGPAPPSPPTVPAWNGPAAAPAAASPAAAPGAASVAGANPPAPGSQGIQDPLCLDGFCPVELCENGKWVAGNRQYGVRHRGRTYLFAGPEQAQRFWSNPDRYAAANSGHDVVMFLEQRQLVPGDRRHGVFFGERIYLFASEATLAKFSQNPQHYANQWMQAMRAQGVVPR